MNVMPQCELQIKHLLNDERCKTCLCLPVKFVQAAKITGFKVTDKIERNIVIYAK